jgi:hypothetical protein
MLDDRIEGEAARLLTVLAAKPRFLGTTGDAERAGHLRQPVADAMSASTQLSGARVAAKGTAQEHKVLHCAYSCAKRTVVMLHHQCLI